MRKEIYWKAVALSTVEGRICLVNFVYLETEVPQEIIVKRYT